ncbi:NAD(P)-binding protein [Xylariomycetidae sp. FL0641]|nr:NAD(P)-binding protein [Xylariomycetidae sp. FL0641]
MEAPNTRPYHLPDDAVWLITGCSSGIGEALSQVVAKTSNRLAATARRTEALSGIPDGADVLKLELDVTSQPSIEAAFAATLEAFGRVDVVVNNAGYTLVGDAEGAGDAESRACLDTNFWGVVDVTKKAMGVMRDENPKNGGQQGGVILQMSSMGGWSGYPAGSFYHAAKFAVEGWTEAVAKEMPSAWNIHFSIIEPGGVKTKYATSSLKRMAHRHPAYADPAYPTNAILGYMLSEQGRSAWSDPHDIALSIYHIVSRGERLPIRVPLGPDSWGMIMMDIENTKKDLEEIKDISMGVGNADQLKSINFLK